MTCGYRILGILALIMILCTDASAAATSFNVDLSPSKTQAYMDESVDVTLTIRNDNSMCKQNCNYTWFGVTHQTGDAIS